MEEISIDHVYERVGAETAFYALVDAFYRHVETDPLLRPMYPDDLAAARGRLALFLIQRFGGPDTYSRQRGHPRLRMRHAPFVIGRAERDTWLRNMTMAIDEVPALHPYREQILRYFTDTADFLVNRIEMDAARP